MLTECILLLSGCGWLPKPTAKPAIKKPHKIELVLDGALAGAKAYDFKTTSDFVHAGWYEQGSKWAIGKSPADHKIVLFAAGEMALQAYLFHKTEHNRHWAVRWTGRAAIVFFTVEHIRAGVTNK